MSTMGSTGGGGSTGAGGGSTGGGGSTAQAMGWGDDWRVRLAAGSTDSEKDLAQLQRYESPEGIWKKTRELERRFSSGEVRTALKKDATSQEIQAWRKENGIVEKPEDYKINLPAGKQAPAEDDPFLKAFLQSAHNGNFTQAQVDQAINAFYAEVERQAQVTTEAEGKATAACEDALRKDWGTDYRVNKAIAENLLETAPAGFKDRFMNGFLADHTPIKASPEAWKWLTQMGREINPAATVVTAAGGDVGKSIGDELASLKKLMANKQSEYWKGPKAEENQARYRDLLTANEKLKARGKVAA